MKLKRGIALLLAAVFLFGTLAVPAGAAAAQPEPAAQAQTVDAEEMISSRCASRHPVS